MTLTAEQATAIIAVIQQDANSVGKLRRNGKDAKGQDRQCVIGGLLTAAGSECSVGQLTPTREQEILLCDVYGLTFLDQSALMQINDTHKRVDKRRKRLIARVQTWTLTPEDFYRSESSKEERWKSA